MFGWATWKHRKCLHPTQRKRNRELEVALFFLYFFSIYFSYKTDCTWKFPMLFIWFSNVSPAIQRQNPTISTGIRFLQSHPFTKNCQNKFLLFIWTNGHKTMAMPISLIKNNKEKDLQAGKPGKQHTLLGTSGVLLAMFGNNKFRKHTLSLHMKTESHKQPFISIWETYIDWNNLKSQEPYNPHIKHSSKRYRSNNDLWPEEKRQTTYMIHSCIFMVVSLIDPNTICYQNTTKHLLKSTDISTYNWADIADKPVVQKFATTCYEKNLLHAILKEKLAKLAFKGLQF